MKRRDTLTDHLVKWGIVVFVMVSIGAMAVVNYRLATTDPTVPYTPATE